MTRPFLLRGCVWSSTLMVALSYDAYRSDSYMYDIKLLVPSLNFGGFLHVSYN